jgi:hypothetical protein
MKVTGDPVHPGNVNSCSVFKHCAVKPQIDSYVKEIMHKTTDASTKVIFMIRETILDNDITEESG